MLEDDDLAAELSRNGRALVERRWDWSVVAQPLLALNERVAAEGKAKPRLKV